ncbi:MAG: type II toxin-antitoxin system Phd/YefM family antitoxin [Desulfobacterales bacterium]|nr:type II toxin-antitoxin system Phd/YefM family antitoxin [Desulfobacterales bacterium]
MNTLNYSIAEGKKNFSKIIKFSEEKKQEIIITRRGNPVSVIISYREYKENRKREALRVIQETRAIYHQSEITAKEIYETSRKMLEEKT